MTRSRWSGAISFRRPTTSSLFSRECSIAFEWRFSRLFTLDPSRVLSGDADLRGPAHLHEEHFPPSLQLAARDSLRSAAGVEGVAGQHSDERGLLLRLSAVRPGGIQRSGIHVHHGHPVESVVAFGSPNAQPHQLLHLRQVLLRIASHRREGEFPPALQRSGSRAAREVDVHRGSSPWRDSPLAIHPEGGRRAALL